MISLSPTSAATCLFIRPAVTSVMISRSRVVSDSNRPPEFGKQLLAIASLPVPFDRLRNGIQHVLLAKRLRQEIDRSCFHSPDRHGDVSVARYHDNGDVNIRFNQLSLEVEAAHSGQPDVEHNTTRRRGELVLQEFRSRAEQSGLKTDRSKQAAQRLANLRVVIDDENDWHLEGCVNLL